MSENVSFGIRLKAARKAAGFKTAREFIEKHDIPKSTYSQHETGSRNPEDEFVKLYAKLFNVRYAWLKDGDGVPSAKMSAAKKNTMQEELFDISPMKQEITDVTLLTKIFDTLLQQHEKQIPKLNTKKLVAKAVKVYNELMKNYKTKAERIKKMSLTLK
jgi:transcriptional regulator with XRE-family HTH domain